MFVAPVLAAMSIGDCYTQLGDAFLLMQAVHLTPWAWPVVVTTRRAA